MSLLTALLVLAAVPAATADINVPATAGAHAQDCDLLAANTVRATLQHIRTINHTDAVTGTQENYDVAVFQVIENLAYKKYVRYGDPQMGPGQFFTVELREGVPGQSAAVLREISLMHEGEEAVIKLEHLYHMKNTAQPGPVHACTRIARKNAADTPALPATPQATDGTDVPPADPAQYEGDDTPVPTTAAPLGGGSRNHRTSPGSISITPGNTVSLGGSSSSHSSSHVQISFGGSNGQMQSIQTQAYTDPVTGKTVKRMFINGTEVDPDTRKPLAPAQPAAAPAKPAAPAADNDTILESSQPGISDDDSF